jgi:DNA polymerase I
MIQALQEKLALASNYVVVDTETTWLTGIREDRMLMGVSILFDGQTYYIPVGHTDYFMDIPKNQIIPSDFFSGIKCSVVFHNAKFDLSVLKQAGCPVPVNNIQDTMIMAHLIWENYRSYSLDNLTKLYKCTNKATSTAKVMKTNWNDMPVVAMMSYATQDVLATAELYEKLLPEYKEIKHVWENVDRSFMVLLSEMEDKGIPIDGEMCLDLENQTRLRMIQIEAELGFDPSKPSQVRTKLFSEPPTGYGLTPLSFTAKTLVPQVNIDFLEKTNHPVCGLLLEYSRCKKYLTSYFVPYQKLAGKAGRLYPSFRQHGTVTGRLSCAEPNLQQIPRTSNVKNVFMPEKNCHLVEIDYSNIEMRLAAVYAQQPELLEEFSTREGDVHGRVAESLKVERFKAKVINFLIIYGGGVRALAFQLRCPESEAKKILDSYKKTYPEIFTTMKRAENACNNNGGSVRLWSDRIRHFPYVSEHHKAFNSVVQGGAFEIVKRSMLGLNDAGFDIRNQVHDSVWLNIQDLETVKLAENIMEDWVEKEFGLPFFVESKILRSNV